jgi:hypothetical protein
MPAVQLIVSGLEGDACAGALAAAMPATPIEKMTSGPRTAATVSPAFSSHGHPTILGHADSGVRGPRPPNADPSDPDLAAVEFDEIAIAAALSETPWDDADDEGFEERLINVPDAVFQRSGGPRFG